MSWHGPPTVEPGENKVYYDDVRGRWTALFGDGRAASRVQYNSEEEARAAAGLSAKPIAEPVDTKASKSGVTEESGRARNAVNQSPAETQASVAQVKQLSVKQSEGEIDKVTGPVKSIGQETLPSVEQSARNFENQAKQSGKRLKASPAMAQLKDTSENYAKTNLPILTSPEFKSSIDTLAKSTTGVNINLKKSTSDNSPEAIEQALSTGLGASPNVVREEVTKVVEVIQEDPKFKDTLNKFPANVVQQASAEVKADPAKVSKEDLSKGISDKLSEISSCLNKQLGNPFGSLSSPFGQIGLDFGNILGSVTGLSMGQGPFQELGKVLDLATGGIDPKTLLPAPPIVNTFGDTQLSKTVRTQQRTAVSEPTVPTVDLSKAEEPQSLADFKYDKIVDKKSFELAIQSVTSRKIDSVIVGWTKNYPDRPRDAFDYNTDVVRKNSYSALLPITSRVSQTHIYIQKSGVAELILPYKIKPNSVSTHRVYGATEGAKSLSKQELYDRSIVVRLDAGHVKPRKEQIEEKLTAEESSELLTSQSITAQQWKTLDLILETMFRLNPGGTFIDALELHSDVAALNSGRDKLIWDRLGIQVDIGQYVEKFK